MRFYAGGGSAGAVIDAVFARLAAADDPGIFIHLENQAALKAAAAAARGVRSGATALGDSGRGEGQYRRRGHADDGGVPGVRLHAGGGCGGRAALRRAGALIVGKTNLDQFATGLVGVRTPYPVPRNPHDATRIPGGSSSGSAVAVARGIVSLALGTDTAGSGRVPAGLNGIVGLKPTLGLVSTRGVVPACRSLDCVSVFALTVADAWAGLEAIAGFDAADAYSRAMPRPALAALPAPLAGRGAGCGVAQVLR